MEARSIRIKVSLLLASLLLATKGVTQLTCRSDGFPPTEEFLLEDLNLNYQLPNTTRSVGYLVIVPEMRFNCHGYITGWSALMHLNSSEIAIDHLIHDITFQLWRPSDRENGIYDFIGSKTLGFVGVMLRGGLNTVNGVQFFNFSVEQNEERLYFQPGDVIGWYIHTVVQSTEIPLTVVYRQSSSSNSPSLQPVDMYTAVIPDTDRAHTQPPCELSLKSSQLTPSIIPYVTALVSPDQPQPESINTMCTTILAPTVNTTTTTMEGSSYSETKAPPPKNPTLVVLTIGIVVALVLVAVVLNSMTVLLTVLMNKRARKKKRSRQLNGVKNVKLTEAANGTRPQDMNNEARYVVNLHRNEVGTTTVTKVVCGTNVTNEVGRTPVTTDNAVGYESK